MAILAALVSAVTGKPLRQDVAVTGEIALAGRVRPVGGVFEKAYGAKQAGIKTLVIPKENDKDIPEGHLGLDIHAVETAEEAFAVLFAPEEDGTPVRLALETPMEKAEDDGRGEAPAKEEAPSVSFEKSKEAV